MLSGLLPKAAVALLLLEGNTSAEIIRNLEANHQNRNVMGSPEVHNISVFQCLGYKLLVKQLPPPTSKKLLHCK